MFTENMYCLLILCATAIVICLPSSIGLGIRIARGKKKPETEKKLEKPQPNKGGNNTFNAN